MAGLEHFAVSGGRTIGAKAGRASVVGVVAKSASDKATPFAVLLDGKLIIEAGNKPCIPAISEVLVPREARLEIADCRYPPK